MRHSNAQDLDEQDPASIEPLFSDIFRQLQRGKCLEKMVYMDDYYLLSIMVQAISLRIRFIVNLVVQKRARKRVKLPIITKC